MNAVLPLRETSVMTKMGKARYATQIQSIRFQRGFELKLKLKWQPARPNLAQPIGTEWTIVAMDSRVVERKDRLFVILPGGGQRTLDKLSPDKFADRHGKYTATRGKTKDGFRVDTEDGWILTYEAGRLKKMQIPDPGQKTAEANKNSNLNTYTWHDPLTAEDKKGGIYDEQQEQWLLLCQVFPDAAKDQPSATLTWHGGQRVLAFHTTPGTELGAYFPEGILRQKGGNLTKLTLNGEILEQYSYKATTAKANALIPRKNQRLLRFDHLVANDKNNYAVFTANTYMVRRDALHRYYFEAAAKTPIGKAKRPDKVILDNLGNPSYIGRGGGSEIRMDPSRSATRTSRYINGPLKGKLHTISRHTGCKFKFNRQTGRFEFTLGKISNTQRKIYYDAEHKTKIRETDSRGRTTAYQHKYKQDTSEVIETVKILPGGAQWITRFDDRDNVIEEIDPLGNATKYKIDQFDNRIQKVSPLGHITKYEYHPSNNRLTKTIYPDQRTELRTYDQFGNLTSITDRAGNLTTHTYDALNQRTSTTNALGHVTKYRYDNSEGACASCGGVRKPSEVIYPNGRIDKTIYEPYTGKVQATIKAVGSDIEAKTINLFDAAFNIAAEIDPRGFKTTYTYDGTGRRLSQTDALDQTWTYQYDPSGKTTKTTYPNGAKSSRFYDDKGNLISETDRTGAITRHTYDAFGNRTSTTDPLGRKTISEYDAANNLIKQTDPAGRVSTYTYDARDRRTKTITYSGALEQTRQYDAEGNLITETLSTGQVTTLEYDSMGRRIAETVTYPEPKTENRELKTTFTYDPLGNLIQFTAPGNRITKYTYDALRNRTATIRGAGSDQEIAQTHEYDSVGNLIAITDGEGHRTHVQYDLLGRRPHIIDPLKRPTEYGYDLDGNLVTLRRPMEITTFRTYDAIGRLIEETDPNGNTIAYHYRYDNRLTGYKNQKGHIFRFELDSEGRRIARIEPDGTRQTYQYDAAGRLVRRTKADGRVATYTYSDTGLLTTFTWDSGPKVTYSYDQRDRFVRAESDIHIVDYTYDDRDFLSSETQTWKNDDHSATVKYTRDPEGRLASASFDDLSTTYKWGPANLLQSVNIEAGDSSYSYDRRGLRSELDYFNEAKDIYTYDPAGQLLEVRTSYQGNTIRKIEYGYNEAGRRTYLKRLDGKGDVFSYDAAGQVTLADRDVESPEKHTIENATARYQYTYDPAGNRQKTRIDGNTREYQPNEVNQYLRAGDDSLTYDPNGNLTSSGATSLKWNENNRLIALTNPEGKTIRTSYDPFGRRTRREVDGSVILYVYDGWNVIAELRENSQLNTHNSTFLTWGRDLSGTLQRAGGVGGLLAITKADTRETHYPSYDGNGNIIQLTNSDGGIVATYEYDPFGNIIHQSGPEAENNPWRFSTKYLDHESGLYNYGRRYYIPPLGRWASRDPIEEQGGSNLYAFLQNQSVSSVDRLGLLRYELDGCTLRVKLPLDLNFMDGASMSWSEGRKAQYQAQTKWSIEWYFEAFSRVSPCLPTKECGVCSSIGYDVDVNWGTEDSVSVSVRGGMGRANTSTLYAFSAWSVSTEELMKDFWNNVTGGISAMDLRREITDEERVKAETWFNRRWMDVDALAGQLNTLERNYTGQNMLLHEAGHWLGMQHPGEFVPEDERTWNPGDSIDYTIDWSSLMGLGMELRAKNIDLAFCSKISTATDNREITDAGPWSAQDPY